MNSHDRGKRLIEFTIEDELEAEGLLNPLIEWNNEYDQYFVINVNAQNGFHISGRFDKAETESLATAVNFPDSILREISMLIK